MRDAPSADRAVGIDHYVSDTDGIGGQIRASTDDFRVRELEGVDPEPLTADTGAYPHLLVRVTLRDWDTNAFARELSDRLGASRERISWAGTKDKRAVTTQLFSIEGFDPDDLPPIAGAEIEPIGRLGRQLLFGDLAGNAFQVTVREPRLPDRVQAITDELRTFGGGEPAVPNYFGHQRFGSIRPVTHEVGLRIVRRDWEGAVLTYVGNPHRDEQEETRDARSFVEETREWRAALDRFPDHLHHERAMLHSLEESGDDSPDGFRAALEVLPWNLQKLFVHAAQSYAFNRILSERLSRGLPFDRAVEDDTICFTEELGGLVVPAPDRLARASGSRLAAVNRHVERGRAFVTAPLVGTETDLASGEPGEIERAVLGELELSPGEFDLPGAFGSTGTRRAVIVRTAVDVERDPLRFSFSLSRGSYATVLLREYLKVPPVQL